MSESITPAISERICKHMNEDHAEAVVLYAHAYGNSPEADSARMISIDPQGMNLDAQVKGETLPLRIDFDHELADAEDAHHTLIAMLKEVRN